MELKGIYSLNFDIIKQYVDIPEKWETHALFMTLMTQSKITMGKHKNKKVLIIPSLEEALKNPDYAGFRYQDGNPRLTCLLEINPREILSSLTPEEIEQGKIEKRKNSLLKFKALQVVVQLREKDYLGDIITAYPIESKKFEIRKRIFTNISDPEAKKNYYQQQQEEENTIPTFADLLKNCNVQRC